MAVTNPPNPNQFLQLAGGASGLRIAQGATLVNFTTGNQSTAAVTVPHTLGRIPVAVLAWISEAGTSTVTYTAQSSAPPDATNIYLYGNATTAAGGNFSLGVWWLAIG